MFGREESKFFKTLKFSEADVKTYGPKMKCMNDPDFALHGNFNTDTAQNLMVVFEKCDRELRYDCKSEEEIAEWMQQKYILILENFKRFVPHKF